MTLANNAAPRLILWDWNGTLLDDVQYAIGVRNRVFPRFGLPLIESLADYHAQFTFPVKDYYYRAGVTDETFVEVANAWMDEYVRGCEAVPLFADALPALTAFAAAGCRQAVLSASHVDMLQSQLESAGIRDRFDAVLGLTHIYATSKEAVGLAYMAQSGFAARDALMLGDTLHDAEVARALGCGCVLVARGHQSRAVLLAAGYPVAGSLTEAAALALGRKTTDA
jgi:phosphoglycolate phosphatase